MLVDVGVSLIQPAMYEIGRLWQVSRVSIAQEHLATAISESLLAQAFAAAEFAPPVRRKALFACVQGQSPRPGPAAGLRRLRGQRLGGAVPRRRHPEPVPGRAGRPVPARPGGPVDLDARAGPGRAAGHRADPGRRGRRRPAVLVGGLALNQLDGLWRDLGADLWSANAKAALRDAH